MSGEASVRDVLMEVRGRGVSVADMARALGRSPRMVRKVLNGETPGLAYADAARELHDKGRVGTPPPRRRSQSGDVVSVRGRGGSTVTPSETADVERARSTSRGFSTNTTHFPEGTKVVKVTSPKGERTKGRGLANGALIESLRSAARGQRWDTRKVRFIVTTSDGRQIPVGSKGGYRVSDVLSRSNKIGRDPMNWMKTQIVNRYPDLDEAMRSGVVNVTGIEMTVFTG